MLPRKPESRREVTAMEASIYKELKVVADALLTTCAARPLLCHVTTLWYSFKSLRL